MDPQRRNRSNISVIVTGSDVNHRTFAEDESWNSLQSTVLAGHLDGNTTAVETRDDLSTVDEENVSDKDDEVDCTQYEDLFNMNIDAIGSDNELFFDCLSYSPNYSPLRCSSTRRATFTYSTKYSPIKSKSPSTLSTRLDVEYGTFLTPNSATQSSPSTETFDSGLGVERTGSLLAQIVDDFNNIQLHSQAQSTPNSDKSSEQMHFSYLKSPVEEVRSRQKSLANLSSRMKEDCIRKVSFAREDSAPKAKAANAKNNKETNNSPADWKPARRVAQIKELFESKSKAIEDIRNNRSSARTSISTKKLSTSSLKSFGNYTRNLPKKLDKSPTGESSIKRSRSPSYKIRSVPKLVITPISSPANRSGSRLKRRSSCSEYSRKASPDNYLPSPQKSRSHSSSEVECNASTRTNSMARNCKNLEEAMESKMIATRPYFNTNYKKKSTGLSTIYKRRSVGVAAKSKSPIRSVKELRKVFSPSHE